MTEVTKEIMRRVDKADIPLEDGEFTIEGVVYRTVEVEGDWKCFHCGSISKGSERIVVCEVFEGDKTQNIFIAQYQEKRTYLKEARNKYRYGECIEVKRQTEVFVTEGWVRA